MKIESGEMKVYSSLSDTGETEESLPVDYSGAAVEIGFNAHYVLDFLRATTEGTVRFLFKDAANAGELRPGGDVDYTYRYIIMPMRI
jgi:DNA polymerase-3 subunit beta